MDSALLQQSLLIILTAAVIASLAAYVKYKQATERSFSLSYRATAVQAFLACMCVPLFLGISGSDIFESVASLVNTDTAILSKQPSDLKPLLGYLKLVGLFVIAAIYAEGFLDKISTAIIKDIKETNSKLQEQESKLERQQNELDETSRAIIGKDIESESDAEFDALIVSLSDQQRSIVNVFSTKTTKYIKTIDFARVSKTEAAITESILKQLKQLDIVDHLSKYDAWYLTSHGNRLLQQINGEENG